MQYITSKTLFRLKLLLLTGTLVVVAIVAFDLYYHHFQSGPSGKRGPAGSAEDDFRRSDEMLHARLWQLQDMDQQFASQVASQTSETSLAQTNASIQLAEEGFRRSLDSISRVGAAYDERSGTNDFQNMTTFFKKILENRRFIAFTRMGIISGSGGAASEKQAILRLQNELYEKDKLIASASTNKTVVNLQSQLGEKDKQIAALEAKLQQEQASRQEFVQANQRLQTELSEKDKLVTSLSSKKPGDQKVLTDLQSELAAKNKQISTLQAQAQSDKQTYTQTVQKLQGEVKEKDRIIASNSSRGPNDQKALQAEINARNKQIADLKTQLEKEQAEKKMFSQTVQKYQNDIAQKNKMIDALSNIKVPSDDRAIANLKSELSARDKRIVQLQAEVDARNKSIVSSATKTSADQKGVIALQNELANKNRQIDNLQIQVRKEAKEKQDYANTIHELQVELIEKNKLIAAAGNRKVSTDQKALLTLQNEIAEKDRKLRRLEDQLQNASIARPASNTNVKDLEERNMNLRLAYNNTMTQLGVLQKKYNVLKAEMDQLKGVQQ